LIGCATVVGDRVVIEADHGRVPRGRCTRSAV